MLENVRREPVLTVAALNEIYKTQDNADVFEMPGSQIVNFDEEESESEYEDEEDYDSVPDIRQSAQR